MRNSLTGGIRAGVGAAPILPGLSDDPELLADVVKAARDHGATHVWANVLYLRPGTREHFLNKLAQIWPELVPFYQHLYGPRVPERGEDETRSRPSPAARARQRNRRPSAHQARDTEAATGTLSSSWRSPPWTRKPSRSAPPEPADYVGAITYLWPAAAGVSWSPRLIYSLESSPYDGSEETGHETTNGNFGGTHQRGDVHSASCIGRICAAHGQGHRRWWRPVKSINRTAVGSSLFFSAKDGKGRELWRSDGTAAGTLRVKDIRVGSGSSNPRFLTAVDRLFFVATNGSSRAHLWTSDGTTSRSR